MRIDDPLAKATYFEIENAKERFWPKVVVRGFDECWEWRGNTPGKGYGLFHISANAHSVKAHRFSFFIHYKRIPDNLVCHTCDTRKCVNPKHLFEGTNQDNMTDMVQKGRGRGCPGEKNSHAKLTTEDIIFIRKQRGNKKLNTVRLGEIYGVDNSTISSIQRGKLWKHLEVSRSNEEAGLLLS